jgi:hypothetical protein
MKKFIILTLLMIAAFNTQAQQCNSKCISHKIDSVCKANNITKCIATLYLPANEKPQVALGKFTFDECFFIVDNTYYFDLSRLLGFSVTNDLFSRNKTLQISFSK